MEIELYCHEYTGYPLRVMHCEYALGKQIVQKPHYVGQLEIYDQMSTLNESLKLMILGKSLYL